MHSKDLLTRFIQWIHFIGSSNGFPHWIRAKDSFGRLPRQGGFAGTIAWSDTGQKLPGLSGRLQPCAIVEREPSVHPRPLPEGGGLRTPRAPSKVPSTTRCLPTTVLLTGLNTNRTEPSRAEPNRTRPDGAKPGPRRTRHEPTGTEPTRLLCCALWALPGFAVLCSLGLLGFTVLCFLGSPGIYCAVLSGTPGIY